MFSAFFCSTFYHSHCFHFCFQHLFEETSFIHLCKQIKIMVAPPWNSLIKVSFLSNWVIFFYHLLAPIFYPKIQWTSNLIGVAIENLSLTLSLWMEAPVNGEGEMMVGGTPAWGPLEATQLRQFNRKLNSACTSPPWT